MNTLDEDPRADLRRAIYGLLIAISAGGMVGRILAVNSVDYIRLEAHLKNEKRKDWQKQRPFLSANDRSRWCTARALVEHGTFAIDDVVSEPNWDTIDMVKHDGHGRPAPAAGEGHLYSSKPPLLGTLMAGEYWLIYHLTGATLGEHPYAVGRFMLITINVVPLTLAFSLLAKWVENFGTSDWGRIFTMGAATFGTFLSTFAVSINNHSVAAVSLMFALDRLLRIIRAGDTRARNFALAGFFGAFTAVNELPALSFFACLAAGLGWRFTRPTLLYFAPAALVVAASALGVNYLSHETLTPAYQHRGAAEDNWYDFEYLRDGKARKSYWSQATFEKRGPIDQGEPSPWLYAFHVLVGHHGIFSLTPVWLFSMVGLARWRPRGDCRSRDVAVMIAAISLVCLAFYLFPPRDEDRNYGGMTSGFRWVFWLAPMWLLALTSGADWASQRRWTRGLALAALGVSVLSVTYPTWNPWTHPWILDFLLSQDWVGLGTR